MSKKEDAAGQLVFRYFQDQNRPYSAQDVFMNLHKEHGKTVVQRAIDSLVQEGKLSEKVNGKQKCYFVNQDLMPTATDEELVELDKEANVLAQELASIQSKVKQLDSRVRQLKTSLTTKEAKQQVERLATENHEMEQRLLQLQNNQQLVTKEEKEKIHKNHQNGVSQWRKRKRMASDVLDSILESWPKPKKDLLEQIGLETDEDVGVKMPAK